MRAEEAARHAVADAHERASAIAKEADVRAREIVERERRSAADEALALRAQRLEEAQAQADATRASAQTDLSAELEAARTRMPEAVAAAIARLVG
jgi:vacuolar-type H+-ATPase subunit H